MPKHNPLKDRKEAPVLPSAIWGTLAGLVPGIFLNENMPVIMGFVLGGGYDVLRPTVGHISAWFESLQLSNLPIAEEVTPEYLAAIAEAVNPGFNPVGITEEQIPQTGSSVTEGGYFTRVNIGDVSLIYKKSQHRRGEYHGYRWMWDDYAPDAEVGARVTDALHELGDFPFIPERVLPAEKARLRFKEENDIGEFFREAPGVSLESIVKGERPRISRNDPMFAELPIEEVMELMGGVYRAASDAGPEWRDMLGLPEFGLHKRLMAKARELYGAHDFLDQYADIHAEEFKEILLTLIQGDLCQSNVLKGSIIDWDKAEFGIAYHDLMKFLLKVDADKNPYYRKMRREFFDSLTELHPGLELKHMYMIDFDIYLHYTRRYASFAETLPDSEVRENMLDTCKYLLDQSRKSLAAYAKLSGNEAVADSFKDFSEKAFASFAERKRAPNTSVAYAHTVEHRVAQGGEVELAEENRKEHQAAMRGIRARMYENFFRIAYPAMSFATLASYTLNRHFGTMEYPTVPEQFLTPSNVGPVMGLAAVLFGGAIFRPQIKGLLQEKLSPRIYAIVERAYSPLDRCAF
ncbi:MAG: hypothetical protein ABH879_02755 [archaeon]